ncbi:MAG: hypothetical protein GF317_12655 [Candidatus Lokiarchaeota archaeon]|nr:hypothetical protein [Candidatus Lokiarchaeota archaeon]MBD3200498.1 hypothetical protein [Candidatus Lokiarchaeota archaeon]
MLIIPEDNEDNAHNCYCDISGTSIRASNKLKEENASFKIKNLLKTSALPAFIILAIFSILGIFFIDAFGAIFTSNPEVIYYSRIMFFWQIIPYILFAIAMNIRGLFFGTGKTYYILIISLVLNLMIIMPIVLLMSNIASFQTYEMIMLIFVLVDV